MENNHFAKVSDVFVRYYRMLGIARVQRMQDNLTACVALKADTEFKLVYPSLLIHICKFTMKYSCLEF